MLDKRRWTTPEQRDWLTTQFPSYLVAQSAGKYDKFWPAFFQAWFDEFPAPEPASDEPTDSEHELDADSEQTDGESRPASAKRKRPTKKSTPNKRVKWN